MSKGKSIGKAFFLKQATFWVFIFIITVLISRAVLNYRLKSGRFSLQEVRIWFENGSILEGREGLEYLGLQKGVSLFDIEPAQLIQELFRMHPEVERIEIYKRLPSALEVKVKNRIPVAQIYLGQYYPLDQEGFVLPSPTNFRQNELPSIRGLQPERIEIGKKNVNPQLSLGLKIVNLLKEQFEQDYLNRIEVDLSELKNVILTLPEGIEVKLGGGNFKEKLLRLNLVLKDIKRRKINPAVIDLRFQKAILVPRD